MISIYAYFLFLCNRLHMKTPFLTSILFIPFYNYGTPHVRLYNSLLNLSLIDVHFGGIFYYVSIGS